MGGNGTIVPHTAGPQCPCLAAAVHILIRSGHLSVAPANQVRPSFIRHLSSVWLISCSHRQIVKEFLVDKVVDKMVFESLPNLT